MLPSTPSRPGMAKQPFRLTEASAGWGRLACSAWIFNIHCMGRLPARGWDSGQGPVSYHFLLLHQNFSYYAGTGRACSRSLLFVNALTVRPSTAPAWFPSGCQTAAKHSTDDSDKTALFFVQLIIAESGGRDFSGLSDDLDGRKRQEPVHIGIHRGVQVYFRVTRYGIGVPFSPKYHILSAHAVMVRPAFCSCGSREVQPAFPSPSGRYCPSSTR